MPRVGRDHDDEDPYCNVDSELVTVYYLAGHAGSKAPVATCCKRNHSIYLNMNLGPTDHYTNVYFLLLAFIFLDLFFCCIFPLSLFAVRGTFTSEPYAPPWSPSECSSLSDGGELVPELSSLVVAPSSRSSPCQEQVS